MTGWSVCGNCNQSSGWSPLLQEVVATARPTWVPALPNCSTSGRSPTITSGPDTRACACGPATLFNGGMITDLGSPFTTCVTSVGCITAPMDIVPTTAPTSDGRPSALENCFETRSRPPVTLSDCALAS